MSSHQVVIINYKQVSDGEFALCTRCCDDPQYTSWHTMHSAVVSDPATLAASIAEHCRLKAANHEAAIQADAALKDLVGTTYGQNI